MGILDQFKRLKARGLPSVEINVAFGEAADDAPEAYDFATVAGMPPHCAVPPRTQQMPAETRSYIKRALLRGKANEVAAKLAFLRQEGQAQRLEDYGRLYTTLPRPGGMHLWQQDDYFAWLWLGGVAGNIIEKVRKCPEGSQLSAAALRDAGADDIDFEELLASGRIHVADLRGVGRARVLPGRVLVPCLAWFCSVASGALKPLAIELCVGTVHRIETPSSDFWTWQMAKAAALCARNLKQQALNHLLETHLVPEVICVGVQQCLSQGHPMRRILEPHLEHIIPINVAARKLLLNDDGLIDRSMASGAGGFVDLIKHAWTTWRWGPSTFHGDRQRRGFQSDATDLDYPFLDDGVAYWDALGVFVARALDDLGIDDAAVAADPELRLLHVTLVDEGRLTGLPAPVDRAGLEAFLTECIFKVTGLHHAMQFNQYAEYGYPPATAAALYRPFESEGRYTQADFTSALPPIDAAAAQITAAHVLERPTCESMLDLAARLSSAGGPLDAAYAALYESLDLLVKSVDVKNLSRLMPFEGFNPQKMPARVEI